MLHSLLLDSATRAQLGIFLFDRKRPSGIKFKIWVDLIDGNICALDFETMADLCDDFGAHKIFEILGWPHKEPLTMVEGGQYSYAAVAVRVR